MWQRLAAYKRRPRRPHFLRVQSVGIGVTSCPAKGSKQWSLWYHPYGSNAFPIRSLKISALKLAHEIWPKQLDRLQNIQSFSKNFCWIRNLLSKHRIPSETSSKCWLMEPLLTSPNTLQNIQNSKINWRPQVPNKQGAWNMKECTPLDASKKKRTGNQMKTPASMRPIFMPDRARARRALWAPGPGSWGWTYRTRKNFPQNFWARLLWFLWNYSSIFKKQTRHLRHL